MKFEQAVKTWQALETAHRAAKRAYDEVFATALLASQQPTAEKRKAEADLKALKERHELDLAEVKARAAEELMVHLRDEAAA